MSTNKILVIKLDKWYEGRAFFKNITELSIIDLGEYYNFKFKREYHNKIRSYDITIRKDKVLFYGVREQI